MPKDMKIIEKCVQVTDKVRMLPKVVNSKEVREVQEGATCFCDRKLSKIG